MNKPTLTEAALRLREFQRECAMGEGRLVDQQKFAADLEVVLDALFLPPSTPNTPTA